MAQTHYKLPIDDEVDKDILDWINSFHRTKKGEMVRHAIRYYMAELEEGEAIKFPSSSPRVQKVKVTTQSENNKSERRRPKFENNALK
jgi:hypothetical protein